MAIGSSPGRVDAQGRIVIPQRFRDALQSGVVLVRGLDQCIEAYPPVEWNKEKERIERLPRYNPNARTLRRLILGSAYEIGLDRQGRAVIPSKLRDHAGITEEVEIVGQGAYFEIWDSERFAEQEEKVGNISDIAAEFGELNE